MTLPLINIHSMKRKIAGILKPKLDQQLQRQAPELNVDSKCAICLQRPSLPHHINCRHIFCYYCLKGNVLADPKFQCPICDFSCDGEIFRVEIKLT